MKSKILGLLAVGLTVGPMSAHAVLVENLSQTAPVPTTYVSRVDTFLMAFSPTGDVTAAVTAVDLMLGLGNNSTSGCEAADFLGFTAGNIALIQRGSCEFSVKAENAAAAGAIGVLIFNQGNSVDREGLFAGTLGELYSGGIPAASLTYALGVEFASTPELMLRLIVRDVPEPGTLALLGLGLAGLGLSRRRKAA